MPMTFLRQFATPIVAALWAAPLIACGATSYLAHPTTRGGESLWPFAINDAGLAAGRTAGGVPDPSKSRSFFGNQADGITFFHAEGASRSEVTALAVNGAMAGDLRTYGQFAFYRAPDGAVTRIFDRYSKSWANGVNSSGTVVGAFQVDLFYLPQAYVWKAGQLTFLTGLGGLDVEAHAINETGTVVGHAPSPWSGTLAFRYDGQQMTSLPNLVGTHTSRGDDALAINASGTIVGSCEVPPPAGQNAAHSHACRWVNDVPEDLGVLGGLQDDSAARAINDAGTIVGNSGFLAFVLDAAGMRDLNTLARLPAGVRLYQATSINSAGWIVADGVRGGKLVHFVLEPVEK